MKKIPILIFMLFCCLIWSCKKQQDEGTVDVGYNYFPVNIGHELVYDVDSFAYDDNTGSTTIDTFHFQYKEVIASAIIDDNGKNAQVIQRYFRKNDSAVWQPANNWTVTKDNLSVQKVEENIRYEKLLFPLVAGKTWDGNSYNDKGVEEYTVEFIDQPSTVNGNTFDKTVKIMQLDNENFIEEIVRYEVYARNVGMIYFLSDSINTQPKNPGPGSKSRGYRYRLKLRSYQ